MAPKKTKEKIAPIPAPVVTEIPKEVELPHGALLNTETGNISFGIDRVTMTLTIDEFMQMCDQIEDIATIVAQMATKEVDECPTCGTKFEATYVALPQDSDFN